MPSVFDFFDRFKTMIEADPWQAALLVTISVALGWYACRLHLKERIEFWKESRAEREAKAEADKDFQKRMTMKQKDARRK